MQGSSKSNGVLSSALRQVEDGVVFTAKIVAGSSRTALAGVHNNMVKVKVSAAPEKGKANQCLVEFLAKEVGVRRKDIAIISGLTNPVKQIRISGISAEELVLRLNQSGKGEG